MKNLKNIATSIAFTLVMLMSFTGNAQKSRIVNEKTLSAREQHYLQTEFRKGMASFVESVRPYYQRGSRYTNFLTALLGENSTAITREGDALLRKAYQYLAQGTSAERIIESDSGKEIAQALIFEKTHNFSSRSGNGDSVLFGKSNADSFPVNNTISSRKKKKCRWYQIGCHVSNVWNWLTADSDGDGTSNFGEVIEIIEKWVKIKDLLNLRR